MSTDWPDYELIDFGDGRKLERFGPWLLDRPCPAALDVSPAKPQAWGDATARYDGERAHDGVWSPGVERWESETCRIRVAGELDVTLQLAQLPSGQVGIFPEQLTNWLWIAEQIKRARATPNVLNLFAYTGASTLAALKAGAEVTHVDAAKSMVSRARENAKSSGLEDAPIRWIVEDVLKFCQREVRRGKRYHGVILDPPSYGHGPKGQQWSIMRDLLPLLEQCSKLLHGPSSFALISGHTPGIGPAELSAYLADGLFGHCGQQPGSGKLYLQTRDGRKLESGVFARWPA